MRDGLLVLLAALFVLGAAIDWIQWKDELEEMWDDEESQEEKQGADDNRGAAGSDS